MEPISPSETRISLSNMGFHHPMQESNHSHRACGKDWGNHPNLPSYVVEGNDADGFPTTFRSESPLWNWLFLVKGGSSIGIFGSLNLVIFTI